MVEHFKNKEAEYEAWLQENSTGFVFNYFGTAANNKLHHARCGQLFRKDNVDSRTTLDKYCSDNYAELEAKVISLCDDKWSKCGLCYKSG
ncbi:hypothetical protein [Paenibacillus spongiae]|uniref:Uncharacterized protein n=1 Tax=Paenibacillus spongiae TaxID=2909671 RepID=A0ABY5SDM8_9BACL|nr:hypothetical protein [Paenibacillus spongiae]UVI32066.1 hypothetical protein L1F29_09715 [Paenibacillus spongiae]